LRKHGWDTGVITLGPSKVRKKGGLISADIFRTRKGGGSSDMDVFGVKKRRIFRNLCCFRTDKGETGSICRDFVRTSFMDGSLHNSWRQKPPE